MYIFMLSTSLKARIWKSAKSTCWPHTLCLPLSLTHHAPLPLLSLPFGGAPTQPLLRINLVPLSFLIYSYNQFCLFSFVPISHVHTCKSISHSFSNPKPKEAFPLFHSISLGPLFCLPAAHVSVLPCVCVLLWMRVCVGSCLRCCVFFFVVCFAAVVVVVVVVLCKVVCVQNSTLFEGRPLLVLRVASYSFSLALSLSLFPAGFFRLSLSVAVSILSWCSAWVVVSAKQNAFPSGSNGFIWKFWQSKWYLILTALLQLVTYRLSCPRWGRFSNYTCCTTWI